MKEMILDDKQQVNETPLTPELLLLCMIPGNIDEIKSYPVIYIATTVRKLYAKNWKKAEIPKQKVSSPGEFTTQHRRPFCLPAANQLIRSQ